MFFVSNYFMLHGVHTQVVNKRYICILLDSLSLVVASFSKDLCAFSCQNQFHLASEEKRKTKERMIMRRGREREFISLYQLLFSPLLQRSSSSAPFPRPWDTQPAPFL